MSTHTSDSLTIEYIQELTEEGKNCLQQGFFQKAVKAYRDVFQKVCSLETHGYIQRACAFNLGCLLVDLHNFEEGLFYLSQAVPPNEVKDGRSNGDLFFNIGRAFEGLHNPTKALEKFERALYEYNDEIGNPHMKTNTMFHIAQLYRKGKEFQKAEKFLSDLCLLYNEMGLSDKLFETKVERASLSLEMKEQGKACALASACFKEFDEISSSTINGKVLSLLTQVFVQLHKYDTAIDFNQKALSIVEDIEVIAGIYQSLGAVYNIINKEQDKAIQYSRLACDHFGKLKMNSEQACCFANMGYAYTQAGKMIDAEECFLCAIHVVSNINDEKSDHKRTQRHSFECLGVITFNQGLLKRSEEYYRKALTALAQSPDCAKSHIAERIHKRLADVIVKSMQLSTQVLLVTEKSQKPPDALGYCYEQPDEHAKVSRKETTSDFLTCERSPASSKCIAILETTPLSAANNEDYMEEKMSIKAEKQKKLQYEHHESKSLPNEGIQESGEIKTFKEVTARMYNSRYINTRPITALCPWNCPIENEYCGILCFWKMPSDSDGPNFFHKYSEHEY